MTIESRTARRSFIASANRTADRSFDFFYRTEYPAVLATAWAFTRSRSVAEEIAQESFVAAHREWDKISRFDNPRAWVRRVTLNKATSWRRRLAAETRALTRIGVEETEWGELSEGTSEVWAQVARLARRQREAVILYYVAENSVEEVAETMGCSVGAVKSHLHRARETLRTTLSEWREET